MTLDIVPVTTARQREMFLRLPERLYRADPAWIPNLLWLQREAVSEKRNPFFEHGEAQLFLALRDGRPVGRISAQVDHLHNQCHGENTGFFGFFEAEEDREVAGGLFEAAEDWQRRRGADLIRGPFNFSVNEELGMLVEGFEHPPMVATTHGLPYYPRLVEAAGYAKAMDIYAYRWQVGPPPARMMAAVVRARAVPGLRLRKVNVWRLERDVRVLLDIFNDAWHENWGFVPATDREARKLAGDLRLIADPWIAIIAEVDGEPAGMTVAIPNLYEAIRDFRSHLNSWNAARLVWRLKVRGLETGRVMLFGVKKKFRTRELFGLPFLLLDELYRGSTKGRYVWSEQSWVLENNGRLNAMMPHWGAEVYKTYRIYEKGL